MSTQENAREQELKLIREAKNEYMRNWRAKNPQKNLANSERYWLKKAAEMKKEAN